MMCPPPTGPLGYIMGHPASGPMGHPTNSPVGLPISTVRQKPKIQKLVNNDQIKTCKYYIEIRA